MTNNEYHAHPALSASGLKLLNKTPAHYYAQYLAPDRVKPEPTKAMKLGTMIHTACLEPHLFDDQYAVMPDGITRQSKEGKQLHADIIASGKEPISNDELKLALDTSAAFLAHPLIMQLRKIPHKIENSIFCTINGIPVKMRPDFMIEPCEQYPNGLIIDLKTTEDASPQGFAKSVCNYEMHIQAAFYKRLFTLHYKTGIEPDFLWFAQEKSAPFLNAVYRCHDALTEYGHAEVDRLLDVYRVSQLTGEWFGYNLGIADIELPAYALNKINETTNEIEVSYVNN